MLTVIMGPMYSGKSSALISKAVSHVIAGDVVVAFKPRIDDRYDKVNIVTHHGDKFSAYPITPDKFIGETFEYLGKYSEHTHIDVIIIDEAQFFDKNQLFKCVKEWCEWAHVIVAGLAQDSYGKPFGAMPELLAYADNIVCLKAVCSKCKKINSATRTYRKVESTEQIVVGGIDMFEPMCFECWNE